MNIGIGKFLRGPFNAETVERAFRHVVAGVVAGFSVQHKEDGTHGTITGDGLTLRAWDPSNGAWPGPGPEPTGVVDADGTDTHTLAGPIEAAGPITLTDSAVVIGTAGNPGGSNGSGIQLGTDAPASSNTYRQWDISSAADVPSFGSLVIYDKSGDLDVLRLRRNVTSGTAYELMPDATTKAGGTLITLGSNVEGSGGGHWSEAYINDVYARVAIYERARSTPMGEWISVAYNASNFTASAGTWTVDSGDQVTYAYTLMGKTMVLSFYIQTTDVSNAASLRIAIPGGFTATKAMRNPVQVLDAGNPAVGLAVVAASGTYVEIFATVGAGNFSVTAGDNTYVIGQITFEVS